MTSNLVALLHLCDSLFPIGAFAHSDGLETATSRGHVQTVADLRTWMEASLDDVLATCEGPAVNSAWRAFTTDQRDVLCDLDDELYALRPSSTGREASRSMGARLLKTWQEVRPCEGLERLLDTRVRFTLPVAFGIVAAASGLPARDAVESYIYTRLAAAVSAAMRLMPLGQSEGHSLLAEMLLRVPEVAERCSVEHAAPRTFAPMLDVAAMSHQYVHSRLFRS